MYKLHATDVDSENLVYSLHKTCIHVYQQQISNLYMLIADADVSMLPPSIPNGLLANNGRFSYILLSGFVIKGCFPFSDTSQHKHYSIFFGIQ